MLNTYRDKEVQTETVIDDNINRDFKTHLEFAGQTYLEHFVDAMKYSGKSLKASLCFFIHALIPDIFTQSGSQCIHELSEIIKEKYKVRMRQLR
jgi:hypothetical protein